MKVTARQDIGCITVFFSQPLVFLSCSPMIGLLLVLMLACWKFCIRFLLPNLFLYYFILLRIISFTFGMGLYGRQGNVLALLEVYFFVYFQHFLGCDFLSDCSYSGSSYLWALVLIHLTFMLLSTYYCSSSSSFICYTFQHSCL